MEWNRDEYLISTDNAKLQVEMIHSELTVCSWACGVDLKTVKTAIEHSLNFGLFRGNEQIGYARFITDYATFAYMTDVFVIESYRGHGLGRWLVECMLTYPGVQRYRRLLLATTSAPWLYEKLGFEVSANTSLFWQINRPDIYK